MPSELANVSTGNGAATSTSGSQQADTVAVTLANTDTLEPLRTVEQQLDAGDTALTLHATRAEALRQQIAGMVRPFLRQPQLIKRYEGLQQNLKMAQTNLSNALATCDTFRRCRQRRGTAPGPLARRDVMSWPPRPAPALRAVLLLAGVLGPAVAFANPAASTLVWTPIPPLPPLPGTTSPGGLIWQPVEPATATATATAPGPGAPSASPPSQRQLAWTLVPVGEEINATLASAAANPSQQPSGCDPARSCDPGERPHPILTVVEARPFGFSDMPPLLRLGPSVPTALQLGEEQSQFSFFQLSPFASGLASGTGNQNYAARFDVGLTDRLQFSAFYSQADDPLSAPIRGTTTPPGNFWESYGGALQWNLLSSESNSWRLALSGSIEGWNVGSGGCDAFQCRGQDNVSPNIFNSSGQRVFSRNLVGALALPFTWQPSPRWAFSLTPGVNFLPPSQGAGQGGSGRFYGTSLTLAGGASWRPIPAITLFGSGLLPLGPGTNSFDGNLTFSRVPILSAGLNWALNPRIAIEGTLTNGWGATPATALLALPSDNRLGYSARFVLTPDAPDTLQPEMTARQRSLATGGLTVNTALVPPDGTTTLWANADSSGNLFGYIGYSVSTIFQLDLFRAGVFNNVSPENALTRAFTTDDGWNWRVGGKAVAFSQLRGAPLSGAGRISLGRNNDPDSFQGYVFAETINTWEATSWLAFNLNPKLVWSGVSTPWGVGLSANVQLGPRFQLIPEVNLVGSDLHASNATLALRWLASANASADVYVSNAAGLLELGQLLRSDQARVGARLTLSF